MTNVFFPVKVWEGKETYHVPRCCIALGGNTGDPKLSIANALVQIGHYSVHVVKTSSSILTPAMGASAGGDFVNAAAVLETDLSAIDVLQLMHHIEAEFGRKRSVHWGPRVIDLDLLLYEEESCDTEDLVLPHPCLWYRRFVLEPLVQVAAEWLHPTLGEPVSLLRAKLEERPLHIEIASDGRASFESIQSFAESTWGSSRVDISLVTQDSSPSTNTFARLIEKSPEARSQPQLEDSRIIRVPITDESSLEAQWTGFLQDFATAVFG